MAKVILFCIHLALFFSCLLIFIIKFASTDSSEQLPINQVILNELLYPNHTRFGRELTEILFKWIGPKDAQKEHIEKLLKFEALDTGSETDTINTIERVGYSYELFNVTSTDGYVTQLIRIVDKSIKDIDRKFPPVVIYGGQSLSPALFVQASLSTQHRNRSLAFELVHLGFDVWLVPARGVDRANKGWFQDFKIRKNQDAITLADKLRRLAWNTELHSYWSFSQDEIVEFEFKKQLDLILKVTVCQSISLITYSNGGLISLAFLASQPEYAKHIDTLISIAPAIFVNKLNPILRLGAVVGEIGPSGEAVLGEFVDEAARRHWIGFCKNKVIRFTACKLFLDSLYGFSDTFNTFIELNMLEHVVKPQPIRGIRQLMQIADLGRFKRFSHGLAGNQLIYGIPITPEYKLSNVNLNRLYLFSGTNDAVADEGGIEKLVSKLGKKPLKHEKVTGYNHLDMIAGWDVDYKVVQPILSILLERDLVLISSHPELV